MEGGERVDYQSVGVNLQDQELFNAKLTARMPWLGGYAGAFDIGDNYLVSSCDGIGTKIQLYLENKNWEGVNISNLGIDLVAMVFNDIVCTGAKPLFMNDYLAVHDLETDEYLVLIDGINKGLKQCGDSVPLISGETAIMPSMIAKNTFDIAGFGVGVCEKEHFIDGTAVVEGDMMLGLKSSGFHSNGYTLIREVWKERLRNSKYKASDSDIILPKLLTPTRIYVKSILDVLHRFRKDVHGIAHITGGGRDNVLRLLGENLNLRPKWRNDWLRPAEFKWVKDMGDIADEEMKRVFNDGLGMILVVSRDMAPKITELFTLLGEEVIICGEIVGRLKQK